MTIDKELLAAVEKARQDIASAELQLEVATAGYHYAIRRLHLGGASLREIGQAINISHQRVQQIVKSSGGSWWSRVWHTRKSQANMSCSFCGQASTEIDALIAGPEVFICNACVTHAEHVVQQDKPVKQNGVNFEPAIEGRKVSCSFCAKKSGDELKMAKSDNNVVCEKCLDICRSILDEQGQKASRS